MVLENLFAHARATPDKIALYYGPHSVSYRDFAFWIACARRFLDRQDLRPGSMAVLAIESLVDSWVLGLALRSMGLTTVSVKALDVLDDMAAEDVGCVVTSIAEALPRSVFPGVKCKYMQIPQQMHLGMAEKGTPELPDIVPGGAHILTTSGTTGIKKKVLIDEHHLMAVVARRAEVYGIGADAVVNVFDFALWTGVGYKMPACAWNVGATIVLHQWPGRHKSLLCEGLTHAYFTPGTLSEVLRAPSEELVRNDALQVFVGGGPLPRSHAVEARERLSARLFTYIGSTECGPWALTPITGEDDLKSHCLLPGLDIQVVDDEDRPLSEGQMGAVRIRTPDMVTGYLDDAEASDVAFRNGFFYSGDLGSFDADGRLALYGRSGNVINVLGTKMSAETIEMALQEMLPVEGVCVLARATGDLDEEIHVAIQSRIPVEELDLAAALSAQLPGLPHVRVHFVASLPRTDTGKLDRGAVKRQLFSPESA